MTSGLDCSDGTLSGTNGACSLQDTWARKGSQWFRLGPPDVHGYSQPQGRGQHSLASTPDGTRVLMMGGVADGSTCDGEAGAACGTVWQWEDSSWKNVTPPGPRPTPAVERKMVYMEHLDRFVVFGQFQQNLATGTCAGGDNTCDDTWFFDGTNFTAASFPSTELTARPAQRCGYSVAYDRTRSRVVLFGGYRYQPGGRTDPNAFNCDAAEGGMRTRADVEYLDDTWEFDGATWTPVMGAGPPVREDAAMEYDTAHHKVVLFGGRYCRDVMDTDTYCNEMGDFGFLADTWTFDGVAWTHEMVPGPTSRRGAALANDEQRGVLMLFGGNNGQITDCGGSGSRFCQDPWAWDGAGWTQLETADPDGDRNPSARERSAATWNERAQNVVLFGGAGGLGDTWLWDAGKTQRPGHVVHVNLVAARIPVDAVASEIRVKWNASAQPAARGTALWGWLDGAWTLLTPTTGTAPAVLEWNTTDATVLRKWQNQADRMLHFMVTPLDASGANNASVTTDDVQVELRFR